MGGGHRGVFKQMYCLTPVWPVLYLSRCGAENWTTVAQFILSCLYCVRVWHLQPAWTAQWVCSHCSREIRCGWDIACNRSSENLCPSHPAPSSWEHWVMHGWIMNFRVFWWIWTSEHRHVGRIGLLLEVHRVKCDLYYRWCVCSGVITWLDVVWFCGVSGTLFRGVIVSQRHFWKYTPWILRSGIHRHYWWSISIPRSCPGGLWNICPASWWQVSCQVALDSTQTRFPVEQRVSGQAAAGSSLAQALEISESRGGLPQFHPRNGHLSCGGGSARAGSWSWWVHALLPTTSPSS